jgi:hypothetical protein
MASSIDLPDPTVGTDVDGNAFFGVIEREQGLNNVRELEDRAGAAFGVEPGMGGLSMHRDGKAPYAFAFCLDVALRTHRRFEDKCPFGTARQHADVRR